MSRRCCMPAVAAVWLFVMVAFVRAALYAFAAARYPLLDNGVVIVAFILFACAEIVQSLLILISLQRIKRGMEIPIVSRAALLVAWIVMFALVMSGVVPVALVRDARSEETTRVWLFAFTAFMAARLIDLGEIVALWRYSRSPYYLLP